MMSPGQPRRAVHVPPAGLFFVAIVIQTAATFCNLWPVQYMRDHAGRLTATSTRNFPFPALDSREVIVILTPACWSTFAAFRRLAMSRLINRTRRRGIGRVRYAQLFAVKSLSKQTLRYAIHVIAPLAIGAWIYIACRSRTLLVFHWLYALHLDPASIRMSHGLPYFIQYCLPDGCWVYAGTSWMLLVWRRTVPWVYVYVLLGVGGEFGQLAGVVPGAFDWFDVLAYSLGFTIPFLVISRCEKTQSNKSGLSLRCS